MLRVDTLQDLFVAAETLARFRGQPRRAARSMPDQRRRRRRDGGRLRPRRPASTLAAAERRHAARGSTRVLPANWSHANPVDIIGDAPAERYVADAARRCSPTRQPARCCSCTRRPRSCRAPTSRARCVPLAQPAPAARARLLARRRRGGRGARSSSATPASPATTRPRRRCAPSRCCATYRRNQAQLLEAAAGADAARGRARPGRACARSSPRRWPTAASCSPSPRPRRCSPPAASRWWPRSVVGADADAAAAAAAAIGFPVALKILSPTSAHKSRRRRRARSDLADEPQRARRGRRACWRACARCGPTRASTASPCRRWCSAPHAHELIVGASIDPVFGPVILFGQGGTAVEVVADRAHRAAAAERAAGARAGRAHPRREAAAPATATRRRPTSTPSARRADGRRRSCWPTCPQIAELDINPLLADAKGVDRARRARARERRRRRPARATSRSGPTRPSSAQTRGLARPAR